jgi:hypothetical protein
MAISQHDAGTQATTVGTEHTLGTNPDTTAGVFQLVLDVSALALGDVLEVRLHEKATGSGGTQRSLLLGTLRDTQADALWVSPTVILLHGWRWTVRQTAGSSRSIPWSIRKVA